MKSKIILILVLLLGISYSSKAQSNYQFIDCFDEIYQNGSTGGIDNFRNSDLFFDNNGSPWLVCNYGNIFYLGHLVNSSWQFHSIPSFFFGTGDVNISMVFDAQNTPWLCIGIQLFWFNGSAVVEYNHAASYIRMYENDPHIYAINTTSVLYRFNPVNYQGIEILYSNPGSINLAIENFHITDSFEFYFLKRNHYIDTLIYVNTQGGVTKYDLTNELDGYYRDFQVDDNGDVWFLYRSTTPTAACTLSHFDFQTLQQYPVPTVSHPDYMSQNFLVTDTGNLLFIDNGQILEFNNGTFNHTQFLTAPIDIQRFKKDSNSNYWFIGWGADYHQHVGLFIARPEGLTSLQGNTFIDWDQSQSFTLGDQPVPLPLTSTAGVLISNNTGTYNLFNYIPNVQTTISCTASPHYQFTTPASQTITTSINNPNGPDFGIYPIGNIRDLSVIATTSPHRPGFLANHWLSYSNTGTTIDSGTVTYTYDTLLNFFGSTPSPDTIIGDTLTWYYTSLHPFSIENIEILFAVNTNAPLGDSIRCQAIIYPITGDTIPTDNIFNTIAEITGSYDPNDKSVYPNGFIETGDWLNYTIRFQNTGTDTAFTIYLRDTLSQHLDLSTLRATGHSHNMRYSLTDDLLEIWFENILLPDSNVNELESHGFFSYKVKTMGNLADGTEINNTAGIYFDFNAPIITNTTENIIGFPDNVKENFTDGATLFIYPNPSTGELNISFSNTQQGTYNMTITDLSGRQVYQHQFEHMGKSQFKQQLEVSPGLYLLNISSENGSIVKKIVVR